MSFPDIWGINKVSIMGDSIGLLNMNPAESLIKVFIICIQLRFSLLMCVDDCTVSSVAAVISADVL